MTIHRYRTSLTWNGSTAAGYRSYSRDHSVGAEPVVAQLPLSADPAFRGDGSRLNPEQLLVMAASSCQLLSFLAEAARAGVDVLGYDDVAEATMDDEDPPARISRIVLQPIITVAAGTDPSEVRRLAHLAHDGCYIANSLTCPVDLQVVARVA